MNDKTIIDLISSGKYADAITYLQERDGITFEEASRQVESMANEHLARNRPVDQTSMSALRPMLVIMVIMGLVIVGMYINSRIQHAKKLEIAESQRVEEERRLLEEQRLEEQRKLEEQRAQEEERRRIEQIKSNIKSGIQGTWVLEINTGYDSNFGDVAMIKKYRFTISGNNVTMLRGSRRYAVGYGSFDPDMTDRVQAQLEAIKVNGPYMDGEFEFGTTELAIFSFRVRLSNGQVREFAYRGLSDDEYSTLKRG